MFHRVVLPSSSAPPGFPGAREEELVVFGRCNQSQLKESRAQLHQGSICVALGRALNLRAERLEVFEAVGLVLAPKANNVESLYLSDHFPTQFLPRS